MKETKAVIFDMDGLIIDSEPYWRLAMIEVFNSLGFIATEEMCAATTGLRIDEVVELWYQNKPWQLKSKEQVCNDIIESVCSHISSKGVAMEGFFEVLEMLHKTKLQIALASSSAQIIIHTVLKRLQIQDSFQVICSGEEVSHGKPHPAIFIETAQRLNTLPRHCTVFEDSIFGMIATKSAHMHSIVVPEPSNYENEKFALADIKLRSLKDFKLDMIRL